MQNLFYGNDQAAVVLKFLLFQTSILLQNDAKEWETLGHCGQNYDQLNWVYVVVMSMGNYFALTDYTYPGQIKIRPIFTCDC